jgi:hypothetical protein
VQVGFVHERRVGWSPQSVVAYVTIAMVPWRSNWRLVDPRPSERVIVGRHNADVADRGGMHLRRRAPHAERSHTTILHPWPLVGNRRAFCVEHECRIRSG